MQLKWGRMLVLFCLATATAIALAVSSGKAPGSDSTPPEVAAPVAKTPARAGGDEQAQAQDESEFDLNSIRRKTPNKVAKSALLEPKSWYAPPPAPRAPPPVSLPPPPPSAPQLPFTYIGKMVDGQDVVLFLMKGDKEYAVRVHDVVDDTYRVEKISETEAVLSYMPMNVEQTLRLNLVTEGGLSHSASVSPPVPVAAPAPTPGSAAPRVSFQAQLQPNLAR